MKKQFVTYEIALKLKELGFDEECFGRYETKGGIVVLEPTHTDSQDTFSWQLASAPLWQQAIDWIRGTHRIDIDISRGGIDVDWYYGYRKFGHNYNHSDHTKPFKSYEDALKAALLKILQLIK